MNQYRSKEERRRDMLRSVLFFRIQDAKKGVEALQMYIEHLQAEREKLRKGKP